MTTLARSPSTALEVVRTLPPEAISKVIEIVGSVVDSRLRMAEKYADFVQEMERSREASQKQERLMAMLSTLLLDAELGEDARTRLVETICALAMR